MPNIFFFETSSNVAAAAVEAFKKECHIERARESACVRACVCASERKRYEKTQKQFFHAADSMVAVPLNSARDSSAKNYLFFSFSFSSKKCILQVVGTVLSAHRKQC